MLKADKIIKDSSIYSISTVVSQLVGVFTSIAMRRFLTPEMMGIWTTFLVILNYALFAHLGVFTAIEVKIPYLRGKNENSELQNMRNSAFTFAIILSVLVILILFAASFILSGKLSSEVILGIRVLAFIITATLFYNLYIVMLRADNKFLLLSKAIVFNSVAMLIFVSGLTYFFKLKGIYFATLFATIASWFYMKFSAKYGLRLYFNLRMVKTLSKIGLPILLAGITYTVLLSMDKIMIIKMIGPAELGYYSIAVLAMTYTHNFPKLFSIVISPTMQEEYGKSDSHKHILEYVKQPALIMAYMFPVVLAAAYFLIPVLVYYVLPKYSLGIDSMRMLLPGCFFIALVPLTHNFVIAINKQMLLIPITAAALLSGIGINYVMIRNGYGITGVASGTSAAYFLYFTIMFFYVLLHCEKFLDTCRHFLKICAPFVYSLIVILVLERLLKINSVINNGIAQILIFYLAYIPMLWYINKKTKLVSMLFKKKNGGIYEVDNTDTVQ